MEYNAKVIQLSKVLVGARGQISSNCDTCKCRDCTNPIELHTVSVYGVNQPMKLWTRGMTTGVVVECDGFIP